jgi:hypothetical protein
VENNLLRLWAAPGIQEEPDAKHVAQDSFLKSCGFSSPFGRLVEPPVLKAEVVLPHLSVPRLAQTFNVCASPAKEKVLSKVL